MNTSTPQQSSLILAQKPGTISMPNPLNRGPTYNDSGFVKTYKKLLRTSPGKYFFSTSICIILIISAGIGNFITQHNRLTAFNYIRTKQEPLREATEVIDHSIRALQNSLNWYLLTPNPHGSFDLSAKTSARFTNSYHMLIQRISSAMTTASLNDPLHLTLVQLNQLAPELTRLYGLGDLIIKNKQVNYTLASAQMASFNNYCDNIIAPITSSLINQQSDYTAQTLKKYSYPSYTSLGLSILAICSLIALSIWYRWKAKRIINKSILLTICIMLCSIYWFYTSATSSSRDIKYINDTVYNRLTAFNGLSSDIISVEYLQFLLINYPYEHNEIFLILKNRISHAETLLEANSGKLSFKLNNREILSEIHDYLNITNNLLKRHNNEHRSFITPDELAYNFTLPQRIIIQADEISNSVERKIVSQIIKAQSRYTYVFPFYYLLSACAIITLNYARLTRMREYR